MASLEILPVELIGHIRSFLDLEDALNLRLASRALANKLSPRMLGRVFSERSIGLDLKSLKKMVYITDHGRAGSLLQKCTLFTASCLDINCTPDADEHRRLLTKAFTNLKRNSPQGGLSTLRLKMSSRLSYNTYRDRILGLPISPTRRKDWQAAQKAFDITVAALRESQIVVKSFLGLFKPSSSCCLVHKALPPLDELLITTDLYKSLETLTMRLSAPYTAKNQTTGEESLDSYSNQGVHGTLVLRNLLKVSSSMPNLKEVAIHWYNVGVSNTTSPEDREVHIAAADYPESARLHVCRLHGLYIPASELLEFLKAIRPSKLSLADVHLVSGTWAPIIDYLLSPSSPTPEWTLYDVREDQSLVHFNIPGSPKFRYEGATMGPSSFHKAQNHVVSTISYKTAKNLVPVKYGGARWDRKKVRMYGPPNEPF